MTTFTEYFQHCMLQMLEESCADILVYGEDMHHNVRLHWVLKDTGLTLNEKCVFAMESIRFLGQLIIADGVALYPNKVRAVLEMPKPTRVDGM